MVHVAFSRCILLWSVSCSDAVYVPVSWFCRSVVGAWSSVKERFSCMKRFSSGLFVIVR